MSQPPQPPRLITMPAAQDRLGLSRSKVEELIRANQIIAVKIGAARRVVEESVDAFIARLIEDSAS